MTAPMDMSKMLGLLINLKELDERKKSRAEQMRQFDLQLEQSARQLGIAETDANYRQVIGYLKTIAETSGKAREAIAGLENTFGWKPEQTQAVRQFALSAPETVQSLRDQAATAGRTAATPQQTAQMNMEAAYGATAGMSQGGAAQSGVQAFLGADGQRETLESLWGQSEFPRALQQGYVTQQAQPMQGAMQEAGVMGGMAPRAAGIQYGGDLTAQGQASLQLQGEGLVLDRIRLAQEAEALKQRAAAASGLDGGTVSALFNSMNTTAQQVGNPDLNPELREAARRRLNSMADFLKSPELRMNNPRQDTQTVSFWQRYMNQYGSPGAVPAPVTQMPTIPPVMPDSRR